jgi:hypothetical protein
MYCVTIFDSDNIAARRSYVDDQLTPAQEAELLRPYPKDWYIDVCRVDQALQEDSHCCWQKEDFYNCFDSPLGIAVLKMQIQKGVV